MQVGWKIHFLQTFYSRNYYRVGKPRDMWAFLSKFVEELQSLSTDGFTVNDQHYTLNLRYIVSDCLARSALKVTKGHSGFYACERYTIKGEKVSGTAVFLAYGMNGVIPRTNQSFWKIIQPLHHIDVSPLIELDGLRGQTFSHGQHAPCLRRRNETTHEFSARRKKRLDREGFPRFRRSNKSLASEQQLKSAISKVLSNESRWADKKPGDTPEGPINLDYITQPLVIETQQAVSETEEEINDFQRNAKILGPDEISNYLGT